MAVTAIHLWCTWGWRPSGWTSTPTGSSLPLFGSGWSGLTFGWRGTLRIMMGSRFSGERQKAMKECWPRISPADLWKPDISLYNKQDLDHGILAADPRSANTNAHIHSNGNILWILPVSHKVRGKREPTTGCRCCARG